VAGLPRRRMWRGSHGQKGYLVQKKVPQELFIEIIFKKG
jgi:hypothetical protein